MMDNDTSMSHGLPKLPPRGMHGGAYLPDLSENQKEAFSIYKRFPLDSNKKDIRILSIHPGQGLETIRCSITVGALVEEKGRFSALSYVWGDVENGPVRSIDVHGIETEVGESLFFALSRIRKSFETVRVWVDFLCIDQTSLIERNHQVGMMKDIYSATGEVLISLGGRDSSYMIEAETPSDMNLVWNGDESDSTAVERYLRDYEVFIRTPLPLQANTSRDFFPAAMSLLSLLAVGVHLSDIAFLRNYFYRSQTLLELKRMMLSEWWNRIWVVQETVLPPKATILYGLYQISWDMLGRAARNLELHQRSCCAQMLQELPPETLRVLSEFGSRVLDMELIRVSHQPILLRDLLWQFRVRDASDAKDKIFALAGLAEGDPCAFVNYDLTIFEAFQRVVVDSIRLSGSLSIIMGCAKEKAPDIPTWMPDWRVPFEPYTVERLSRAEIYSTFICRPPNVVIRNHDGKGVVLAVEAVVFNTVAATSATILNTASVTDLAQSSAAFQEWLELARGYYTNRCDPTIPDSNVENIQYVGGGSLHDAFLRTLCADTIYIGSTASLPRLDGSKHKLPSQPGWWDRMNERLERRIWSRHNLNELRSMTRSRSSPRAQRTASVLAPQSPPFNGLNRGVYERAPHDYTETITDCDLGYASAIDHAVRSATAHRKFYVTIDGYIGLGPTDTCEGDEVALLLGASTPFVLRPRYNNARLREIGGSHSLVGDCYVHGVMFGELTGTTSGRANTVFLV